MLNSHRETIFEALGRGPIHPFPARMAPGIALEALSRSRGPLRVLDPMMGSGTVLAMARAKGHKAFGVDLDPLAVLLAGVWTRTVDANEVKETAEAVLARARVKMKRLRVAEAYPPESDEATRAFVRYWFDPHARRQLTSLAAGIRGVREAPTRDVLWCGFSRLIITKQAGASRAMDLSHSRPHRFFEHALVKPFRRFEAAVDLVVSNCPQRGADPVGPTTHVGWGDARDLNLPDGTIDLVLTSPPYLNAIDYMRCSKFSLVWMGHKVGDLRGIRARSVGTEASVQAAVEAEWVRALLKQLRLTSRLSSRDAALLSTYAWDMGQAVAEVSRVLKRRGRAVYVVGESTVRGTFVRNSRVLAAVAERHGLRLVSRTARALPANRRYLPPPKEGEESTMSARMRREVIIEFRKP